LLAQASHILGAGYVAPTTGLVVAPLGQSF
jgi:hypothetical protein